jgi:hypothetical protein
VRRIRRRASKNGELDAREKTNMKGTTGKKSNCSSLKTK